MILPEFFERELIKYCEIHKIPIRNGMIPIKYKSAIETYIEDRLRKERFVTRQQEEKNRLTITLTLASIMGRIQPNESPIEMYLWDALEREGLTYMARKHFGVGCYEIDIAFPVCKLAIECDGVEYHRANQLQLERDQKRDKYLAQKGWRTLRIEGIAIRRNINFCIEKIKNMLGDFAKPAFV